MKFNIITTREPEQKAICTGNNFIGSCNYFGETIIKSGKTREGVVERIKQIIQRRLDHFGAEIEEEIVDIDQSEAGKANQADRIKNGYY